MISISNAANVLPVVLSGFAGSVIGSISGWLASRSVQTREFRYKEDAAVRALLFEIDSNLEALKLWSRNAGAHSSVSHEVWNETLLHVAQRLKDDFASVREAYAALTGAELIVWDAANHGHIKLDIAAAGRLTEIVGSFEEASSIVRSYAKVKVKKRKRKRGEVPLVHA